jgi:putative hydrolase of the HAD superfamily
MCAPDTPALWRSSPFATLLDVEVFSCEVGLRKPEPEIYLKACELLDVEASRCFYVGDGAYAELSGATAVGMTAVLIHDPADADIVPLRPEAEDWNVVIADLREISALVFA